LPIVIILALLTGCTTLKKAELQNGPVLVSSSKKKPPSWITVIPEEKRYFYYVGTSTDSPNFDAGKEQALSDALSQVVATIGVRATASASFEERYFAEQFTTTIESELLTRGKAKLQDAEVKEIYFEQWKPRDGTPIFRVWLLLKYGKDAITQEQERLATLLRLKSSEVLKYEELAAQNEQANKLIDAVFAHLNASVAALKLEDGEVFFDRNITGANELLLKVQMRKYGEDQVGFVGESLPQSLRLKVYFMDGETEIPVANAPIKFSYRVPKTKTTGYKLQVSSAVTDSVGMASFTVDKIYEVSDENRVVARLDLSPLLSQLKSAPQSYRGSIESLRDVLGFKKTTFIFKSDTYAREINTGVFFIQLDEDGAPLPKPITAPVIYDVLYEKRFSIRVLNLKPSTIVDKSSNEIWEELDVRAPEGVQRILVGRVMIVEYDTISGFETAKALAHAVLYDREKAEILRTWQIQQSGTGTTREGARLNALTQVGRSLGEIMSNTMP
jgi:hypothetical protein